MRDVKHEDKKMIRKWRNMPKVSKWMYTDHNISEEEHERWFRRIFNDEKRKYWIIAHNGNDVGLVNLYDINEVHKRCSWAFYLADMSVRGKGIGSYVEYFVLNYVFEELNFNRLCCEVIAFNENVANMHKRYGFSIEGIFREHIFKNGEAVDVISLAILKRDWNKIKQEIKDKLKNRGLI